MGRAADRSRRPEWAGLRRALPHGLRWRLTAWVAAGLVATLAITFGAVYQGTGSQLRHQLEGRLVTSSRAFAADASAGRGSDATALIARARAYVNAQPFASTSRLLYLSVPGGRAVTNEPELLGLGVPDAGESTAGQVSEDSLARALIRAPRGYSTINVPDVGPLRLLVVPVRHGARVVASVGSGEPLSSVAQAQEGVARTFLVAGGVALVVVLLASYAAGERVSRPLRRMARVAARVDGGDLAPRMHAAGARDEVRVLADAFDHMLDRLADAFARQRSFVSDASHELRTPLTVIRGQLEVLARQEHPDAQEVRRVQRLVSAEVSRMSRLVDELLALAHSAELALRVQPLDVHRYLSELWEGVAHTATRSFESDLPVRGQLRADPDRLAQALRNLAANAVAHTYEPSGRVRLSARVLASGRLSLTVEDDGPGIPADQRERVFDRFHRTDAARTRSAGGTGLGLAIVRDAVEAHGGQTWASRAPTSAAPAWSSSCRTSWRRSPRHRPRAPRSTRALTWVSRPRASSVPPVEPRPASPSVGGTGGRRTGLGHHAGRPVLHNDDARQNLRANRGGRTEGVRRDRRSGARRARARGERRRHRRRRPRPPAVPRPAGSV